MDSKKVVLPNGKSIFQSFINDFNQVQHLFTYNPAKFLVEDRVKFLREKWAGNRFGLVQALSHDNLRLGAGHQTMDNIADLAREDTVAVVTGQQIGLFTGPLLTIYKTLTAIFLCRVLKESYNIRAVPVFWAASEDHDYQEINHIYCLNSQEQIQRININYKLTGTPAVGSIPVREYCHHALQMLGSVTAENTFKDAYLRELEQTLEQSGNLADWFGRQLLRLFSRYGLVYFNPMLPGLRILAGQFFQEALVRQQDIHNCLTMANSSIVQLGYEPAVLKAPEHTHLFMYEEVNRQPLMAAQGGFRAGNSFYSSLKLAEMLRLKPENFSPDVILRPVLQDYLLPTLAYVAGPGEVNYWAQLREVFSTLGTEMPILYPRASFTLVEPAVEELLKRNQVAVLEEIWSGLEEKKTELLMQRDKLAIKAKFMAFKQHISREIDSFTQEFMEKYSDLDTIQAGNVCRIMEQLNYLENKVWERHSRENKEVKEVLDRIIRNLSPNRCLQESIFNIFPYLFKWGPNLFEDILEHHNQLGDFSHKFIFTGR